MAEINGIVVLGFGPQPMDFLSKAAKLCGKDAVVSPDVARMAGANLAAGSPAALSALRSRLEEGALSAQKSQTPALSAEACAWLANGRRGVSSNTIFTHLTGIDALGGYYGSHPHDPDDLDRCLALLEAVPELRDDIRKMAQVSPYWAALIDRWHEIKRSHIDEVGLGWTKAKSAPKTYALMREILDGVNA
jgi:hypothetical protein